LRGKEASRRSEKGPDIPREGETSFDASRGSPQCGRTGKVEGDPATKMGGSHTEEDKI